MNPRCRSHVEGVVPDVGSGSDQSRTEKQVHGYLTASGPVPFSRRISTILGTPNSQHKGPKSKGDG
jgi:hypothetical protein